jgi:hypothetical protein
MSSSPNFEALLGSWWGGGYVDASFASLGTSASNLVVSGTNPPYYPADLFAMYPRFGGVPLTPLGTTTLGSATITIASAVSGLAACQPIIGSGVPDGATITSVSTSPAAITILPPPTATDAGVNFTVFAAPLLPMAALNIFINLASASLNAGRWLEMWPQAMNLYVAHLAQLWLSSEGSATSPAGSAAMSGLARGIATSKSVGDVSVGYQALAGDDDYVDLNLTLYGEQLIRLCKVVGSGPIFVW